MSQVNHLILDELAARSNEQLWMLVYQRLSEIEEKRLHDLLDQGGEGTLSPLDQGELDQLTALVMEQMLLRSQALVLLQQRGEDVNVYLKQTVAWRE